jgi:hypothetical protein
MILKLFLIFAVLALGFWLIKERQSIRVRAWQKIIILFFVIGTIITIVFPGISLKIAKFAGLNRSTDLIVYGTIVLLLFVIANVYIKFQDVQRQIYIIAQEYSIHKNLDEHPSWIEKK